MTSMAIFEEALYNAPTLKSLDVSDGIGNIVAGLDASLQRWGAILQQEDKHKDRHPYCNESALRIKAQKKYDAGKRERCGLMKELKKFLNYVYGVRFLLETDANTLVHQLNLSANDLPGAQVSCWVTWIRRSDFDVNHVPGTLNEGPDGLPRRPLGEEEPEHEDEDDLEEAIETSLRGIQVEQGSERERRERP
jgi:hypothetical protein